MSHAAELDVPLNVDSGTGNNWFEAIEYIMQFISQRWFRLEYSGSGEPEKNQD